LRLGVGKAEIIFKSAILSISSLQANERKAVSIQADDPIAFMQLLATAENEILEVWTLYSLHCLHQFPSH
jgi:hypothetical protein